MLLYYMFFDSIRFYPVISIICPSIVRDVMV